MSGRSPDEKPVSRARYERERAARREAERLAESRSRELYEANLALAGEAMVLEARILESTRELRAERDRAEAATRAKSDFLANMSHELRTPLNAILGFSEIIKDEIFGAIAQSKYVGFAQDIHASGQHLLTLINSILELSKVEAGCLEFADDEFDLQLVTDDVYRLLVLQATKRGVDLRNEVPAGIRVRADGQALRRVLINLVSNALKFTPTGKSVRMTFVQDDGFSGIRVIDQGCGIRPQDMEQVFERFGQGRHEVARRDQGTGLGLPIARGTMRAHGGDLWLTSTLGEGTVAHASLSRARVRVEAPGQTACA
jgi:two-component system cell cycle sensor histidine kinase PleC